MTQNRRDPNEMSKSELKAYINENGFFQQGSILEVQKNAPEQFKNKIPEGAVYFRAIASDGNLNRNGYIIRENAWKSGQKEYKRNPIVLLGHDSSQPIGKLLSWSLTENGLEVEGYAHDDYTEGRLTRGLLNALSTGHITEAYEFQNMKTGEVITREEFRQLAWEEMESGDWVMAVTKLDWIETSIVAIGANKNSLLKEVDVMKNYIEKLKAEKVEEILKNDAETTEEVETPEEPEVESEEAETPAEEVGTEGDAVDTEESNAEDTEKEVKTETETEEIVEDEPETAGENPVSPEVAENAVKEEVVTIAKNEIDTLNNAILKLYAQNQAKDAQIASLKELLDTIPMPKGLVVSNGAKHDAPKKEVGPITSLLQANGIIK